MGLGRLVLGALDAPYAGSVPSLEAAMINYLCNDPCVSSLVGCRFYPHQQARQNAVFPLVTYYRAGTFHEQGISGSLGFAHADIALDIWSTVYLDVCRVAEAIRRAIQAYQGCWGRYGILDVVLEDDSDNVEAPADGSGTWFYSRSLDYRVMYQESL